MAQDEINEEPTQASSPPLVFISHDSRDAELAEAFSKLLKSVSAGMLKSFRSTDKKAGEGIEFGDEWYKRLMTKLASASDVVCLFTERSLNRPWILYEAGVAKGKLETPVHGVALGIPLSRVASGPFYQFQNCDDSEEALIALVLQLARRISDLEPDEDVVKSQVKTFKERVKGVLTTAEEPGKKQTAPIPEASVSKLFEEVKVLVRDLPERIEGFAADRPSPRRYPARRIHPGMLEDLIHMISREPGDPVGILVIASFLRDENPWLYEIAMDAYHAAERGGSNKMRDRFDRLRRASEVAIHGPWTEEFGGKSKEMRMFLQDLPAFVDHVVSRVEAGSGGRGAPLRKVVKGIPSPES